MTRAACQEERVLYLDLVGGVSGDMLLAALIDAGAPLEAIQAGIAAVGLRELEIKTRIVHPAGLRARSVEISVEGRVLRERGGRETGRSDEHGADDGRDRDHDHSRDHDHEHDHGHDHDHSRDHGHDHDHADDHSHGSVGARRIAPTNDDVEHRPYRLIRDRLVSAVGLEDLARRIALDAFRRLAEAEAEAHGGVVEEIEFHEVGSNDAIADVVGVASAIAALKVGEIVASPVPIGRGLARSAHGPIPLPGPATLDLLRGAPIEGTSLVGETVTPTGAALLRALTTRFGNAPPMILEAIGVGAGRRRWPDRPNILRAIVGQRTRPELSAEDDDCVVEANIDDMSPEHLAALHKAIFEAGAVDVWSTAISMKKNRMGALVSALVRRTLADVVATTFFIHSTTLGVRVFPVARVKADRRIEEVETEYGRVRVKISERPSGPPLIAPEFDDCERWAKAGGVSVRAVAEAALRAAWARSSGR